MNINILLAAGLVLGSQFLGTVQGSVPLCPHGQTTIFFANGVLNTYDTAQASQAELQIRLENALTESEFECLDFSISFNASSQEVLGDSTLQKAFAFALDAAQSAGQSLTTFSRRFWTALEGFAAEREWDWLAKSFAESAASVDRAALLLAPEAGRHAENYIYRVVVQKNKVVVVGHSQGNFYANQAYFLVPSIHGASLGLVAVATFDSFVAGQTYPYAYTTLFEDSAILAAMAIAASIPVIGGAGCTSGGGRTPEIFDMWPLCPNLSNLGANEDRLGHKFATAYLVNGSASESRIVTQIKERISLVDSPPTRFVAGDRVRIADVPMSVAVLNVPAGNIVGTQSPGSTGVVRSSPRYATSDLYWYIDFDEGVDGWVEESLLEAHVDGGSGVQLSLVNNQTCEAYGVCNLVLEVGEESDITSFRIEIDWGDGLGLSAQSLSDCLSAGACQYLGNGRFRVWKLYAESSVAPYSVRVSYDAGDGAWVTELFSANVSATRTLGLDATPSDSSVNLSWVNIGADRYNVCRATEVVAEFDNCSVYAGGELILDIGAPPNSVGGLTNGTTYHFRLEALFGNARLISSAASAIPEAGGAGPVAPQALNDTGIDWCADGANNYDNGDAAYKQQQCEAVTNAGYPGQDGHYGRDAAARAGTLTKVGGGSAGFDFTKIANNGAELPASATLGSGPSDWACTRDNVTGLIWEVKTTDGGLRDYNNFYTWYQADGFVQAGNAGLCGAADWRLPTVGELHSIVHHGFANPAVDTGFFPNTPSSHFWSASPFASPYGGAWYVNFRNGYGLWAGKSFSKRVRLVRGGQ